MGRLRIGMSDDLALTRLPAILRDFRTENPRVDLELTVDQSGTLHRRLENDRLDIFIGKRPPRSGEGKLVRRERLVWVGNPSTRLDLAQPVPLAVYPSPSISGAAMHEALDRVGHRLPLGVRVPRGQRPHRRGRRRDRGVLPGQFPGARAAGDPGPAAQAARARARSTWCC